LKSRKLKSEGNRRKNLRAEEGELGEDEGRGRVEERTGKKKERPRGQRARERGGACKRERNENGEVQVIKGDNV